jgi:hypothetical protein
VLFNEVSARGYDALQYLIDNHQLVVGHSAVNDVPNELIREAVDERIA